MTAINETSRKRNNKRKKINDKEIKWHGASAYQRHGAAASKAASAYRASLAAKKHIINHA
jgi:hypothetical protein